jgi:hypothetical protein
MKPATHYSPAVARRLLDQVDAGVSLAEACREEGMPSESSVRKWVQANIDGFGDAYRRVRGIDAAARPFQPCWSPELADAVIEGVTAGQNLAAVLAVPGMPSRTTVNVWVAIDRDGFGARYRQARQIGLGQARRVARTPEIEDLILDALMSGRTLTDICRDPDMPAAGSVRNWVIADPDGFGARYRLAREIGAETMADTMVDIADDRDGDWIAHTDRNGNPALMLDSERVNRARMRIETRRWRVSKIAPRIYGDRIDLTARPDSGESWADLLKAVDGKTLGLPHKRHDEE